MGLFGKKKKEQESEAQKTLRDMGLPMNDVQEPKHQTRKDGVEQAKKGRISTIKKDQILEKMNDLRKELYSNPDFEGYSTQLEEIIGKFRKMQDNSNLAAMSVVDSFILKTITEATNYSYRGNYIAMGACIFNLDQYVSDRFLCGNYYTNPEFCKLKVARDKLYIEQQNLQSEYDNLEKRMAQLKLDSAKPGISKEAIARAAMDVKAEGARIKQLLDKAQTRIQALDKGIKEYRESDMNHGTLDFEDAFENIFETKRENEIKDATFDKYNEKLDQSNRKVSSAALNVNGDVLENDKPIEFDDDFFKL